MSEFYCNLKNWVAVGLLALATGTVSAQCVDMSTLDDGNKRFINIEAGITFHIEGKTGVIDSIGWKPAYIAPTTHPRQTLMTAEGTDNLCKELSVLPPNETTSVRLMNDGYQEGDSAKGEWMAFRMTVDPDNPIILINYAAVLEAPGHANIPGWYQPYCGFYAQNLTEKHKDYGAIYGELYHYTTDKASIKGWESFTNSDRKNIQTYWKDWSKVGIDLSQWAGCSIGIVLFNYDCAIRDTTANQVFICTDHHEAHMYAHITCAPKKMVVNRICNGDDENISITAPEGFSYRWYEKNNKATIISTRRILHIPTTNENVTYVCELTNHVGTFELEQTVDAYTTKKVTIWEDQLPYTWEGISFTTAGTETKTLQASDGCDSIVTFTLRVLYRNITLQENEAADFYTQFAEDYNGRTVTTATLNRQFTQGKWATLCLPFNVNKAMMTALGLYNRVFELRYAEQLDAETIQMYFAPAQSIEAGKGYIVNPNAKLAAKTSFVFPNVTINTDSDTGDITSLTGYNDGTNRGNLFLVGTLRTGILQGSTTGNTWLGLKDNQLYYPNSTSGTPMRAYRAVFRNDIPVNASRLRIIADGETRH